MAVLEQKITLQDACKIARKSEHIFSPIKEAITNSLDSIDQKQKIGEPFVPYISLCVCFKTIKNVLNEETHTLDSISVEDNGLGFTRENLERFKKFADRTKKLQNRGTGKIQIFCRFNKMSIDSIFYQDGESKQLKASWEITGDYEEEFINSSATQATTKTIVKMSDFSGGENEEKTFLDYLNDFNKLKRNVLKHLFLRLWLGVTEKRLSLKIQTFLESEKKEEFTFDESTVPSPDKTEEIIINTEQMRITEGKASKTQIDWIPVEPKHRLMLHRFKIPKDDIEGNGIYMCSKGILVESIKSQFICKNKSDFNGFQYLSSISGELLDEPSNVNETVDGFKFPSKNETEQYLRKSPPLPALEEKYVFREEIHKQIGRGLSRAYADIEGLKEETNTNTLALARQYGISKEDAEAAKITFIDTEEEATGKLFETQAKRLAKQSIEIQKTYNEIKNLKVPTLDPTSEEYRSKFNELSTTLLEQIPQLNKDELARYVIRRDMVVELLKLALKNDLNVQKEWQAKKDEGENIRRDTEGIIHDIIFKRRMKGIPNDLWILNEEFVHFDGYSDLLLKQLEVNDEKLLRPDIDIDAALKAAGLELGNSLKWRPDIFLYPEEGKCIIVEFKAPDVELSIHLDQIQKYAKILANYSTRKFTQFYGFLIGEQINPMSIPDRYKQAPYGNYWIYSSEPINSIDTRTPIADIYQEIIPLSEIVKRAELRNRSFAEKLGITKTDLNEIREKVDP